MNEFMNNLKRQAENNPVVTLVAVAGLLTAASKVMGASVDMRNAKAWSREVQRRAMKDAMK